MLDSYEVCADKGNMVDLSEHLDDAGVVDTRNENGKEISEERRLLLKVERQSLVVASSDNLVSFCRGYNRNSSYLDVCNANNNIFELIVLPSIRRSLNHCQRCIILPIAQYCAHRKGARILTNSSYLTYKKTSSDQRCAFSVALIT